MFFNQPTLPKFYAQSLDRMNMDNIALLFLQRCIHSPEDNLVCWKNSKGDYSMFLNNTDVLQCTDLLTSIVPMKSKVAIMSKNLPILFPLEMATWLNKGYAVSIYNTDEVETIKLKLQISSADVFACDAVTFEKIKDFKDFGSVKTILLLEPSVVTDYNIFDNVRVIEVWDIINNIKPEIDCSVHTEKFIEQASKIKPDDVAKIIFSSGTTGDPKMIPLSHKNFITTLKGWSKLMHFNHEHRILAYLPNAHVFQTTASYLSFLGLTVSYISEKLTLAEDISKVRPNLFMAVPLVLDVFKVKIITKLKTFPFLKNFNFKNFNENSFILKLLVRYLYGRLVVLKLGFSKCQWLISGGAALSDSTFDFFHDILGMSVRQGYGLTETAAGVCCNGGKVKKGSSGPLIEGVKVKIDEDGILYVKGDSVSIYGYDFKKDHLDEDGYFCTQDRAEIDEENYLFLKGREGNRVKMANGKYFNIEDVSNRISSLYTQFSFVIPSLESKQNGTLIVSMNSEIKNIITSKESQDILENIKQIKDLPNFEKIIIFPEIFVENNLLTPTQKVRFQTILKLWEENEHKYINEDNNLLIIPSLDD
jgi:long-chain acyl-CoA synthetase